MGSPPQERPVTAPGEREFGGIRRDPADDPIADPEAAYGGADAVGKTTYVVGMGTDPDARPDGPVIARVRPGGGANVIGWLVIALAILVALVYGVGVLR
jgi:hypothetical protein